MNDLKSNDSDLNNQALMKNEIIWTDISLDGACSYLVFNWIKGSPIEVKSTSTGKFNEVFTKWRESTDTSKYDNIYILNLNVSNSIELVDHSNITIIDNSKSHNDVKGRYKNAKTIIKDELSTSILLLNLFIKKKTFTAAQAALVYLVTGFESGECKMMKMANELNTIYWGMYYRNLPLFASDFAAGFSGFSTRHQNVLHICKNKLEELISDLVIYTGDFKSPTNDKYSIVSVFANQSHSELCDYLIDKTNSDIAIIVNTETQNVFFKRAKKCKLSMCKLAEVLCGGGGNDVVSGGSITDKFMEFTKILKTL